MLLLKDCMYKSNKDANDEDGDDGVKVKSTNSILLSLFILFFGKWTLGSDWNDNEENGSRQRWKSFLLRFLWDSSKRTLDDGSFWKLFANQSSW